MNAVDGPNQVGNRLLRTLGSDDLALILPQLKLVELTLRERLVEPGKPVDYFWFPEDAVVSNTATTPSGRTAEIALTGCEGVVDLGALNGVDTSPFGCVVQIPGRAWRLPIAALHTALDTRVEMRRAFRRYKQAFVIQVAHTALVSSAHTIEQRLARWLLMAHDRIIGNEIAVTHEILSLILGVRRAGVTICIRKLENLALVETRRLMIRIVDRPELEKLAADAYGLPESEYCRLLGADFRHHARQSYGSRGVEVPSNRCYSEATRQST